MTTIALAIQTLLMLALCSLLAIIIATCFKFFIDQGLYDDEQSLKPREDRNQ